MYAIYYSFFVFFTLLTESSQYYTILSYQAIKHFFFKYKYLNKNKSIIGTYIISILTLISFLSYRFILLSRHVSTQSSLHVHPRLPSWGEAKYYQYTYLLQQLIWVNTYNAPKNLRIYYNCLEYSYIVLEQSVFKEPTLGSQVLSPYTAM